jgi:integrase
VHRLVALPSSPCDVPTAVARTRGVTDQAAIRPEAVPLRASSRRDDDPLAGPGSNDVTYSRSSGSRPVFRHGNDVIERTFEQSRQWHTDVRQMLVHLALVAGLTDAGVPVHFTPHDFRRLFATDAVNNGLPLHIAAALLSSQHRFTLDRPRVRRD